MRDNGIDIDAVVARVQQWLAEGKDIRIFAARAAVKDFPMIEMWDGQGVQVITRAGTMQEGVASSPGKTMAAPQLAAPSPVVRGTRRRERGTIPTTHRRALSRSLRAQPSSGI
jgi:hypothetical protein